MVNERHWTEFSVHLSPIERLCGFCEEKLTPDQWLILLINGPRCLNARLLHCPITEWVQILTDILANQTAVCRIWVGTRKHRGSGLLNLSEAKEGNCFHGSLLKELVAPQGCLDSTTQANTSVKLANQVFTPHKCCQRFRYSVTKRREKYYAINPSFLNLKSS